MLVVSSMWIEKAMLNSKQSAAVAPEVNVRNSAQERKHESEALKPRTDVTRSPKTRVPVALRKGLM